MPDLFDELNEVAKKESSGGGIVGKIKLETGYKVFVSGLGNRESFFPCDLRDGSKDKDKAHEQAKALGKCQAAVQIVVYKDSVKGRDVSWQDDRFFCYPLWTDAAKKVVLPSLKTANVTKLGEMWGRIAFADDPSGRMKTNQNGDEVVDKIAFIAEVYKSENAALAAVAGGDVEAENKAATAPKGKVPEAWEPADWEIWIRDFSEMKEFQGKSGVLLKNAIKAVVKREYDDKKTPVGATIDEIYDAMTAK